VENPENVLARRGACGSYQRLIMHGMERYLLRSRLWILYAEFLNPLTSRAEWGVPKGMTWRSLRGLPKRLADLAVDIERVNQDSWFRPNAFLRDPQDVYVDVSPFEQLPRRFLALPGLLRSYESYFETRRKEIARFRQGPGRANRSVKNQVFQLLEAVDRNTGRPHYREVADLLAVLAPENRPDLDFNEAALRQCYKRTQRARKLGKAVHTPADFWTVKRIA